MVLITTKTGKVGTKANINVYSNVDIASPTKWIDVMDALTYAKFRNEMSTVGGKDPVYHIENGLIYPITYTTNANGEVISTIGTDPYVPHDWQKEIYQSPISNNEGLSISGRSANTGYYFSVGFSQKKGLIKNSGVTNGNIRLNLTQKILPKLNLDTRISANYTSMDFANAGQRTGPSSLTAIILRYRPLLDDTNNEVDLDNDLSTPLSFINDYDDLTKEKRLNGVVKLDYEILKGFKYQFQAGLDYRDKERTRWYGPTTSRGNTLNGDLGISTLSRYAYTINHLLTYDGTISKIHRLNAVMGFTYDGSDAKNSNQEFADFPLKALREKSPQSGQLILSPLNYYFQDQKIASALVRTNYTLRNKYTLTATFRADGSSKFAKGNKWGYFPAIGLAWNMQKENFLKKANFLDALKIRAGWGQTGNQSINPYSTIASYSGTFYAAPNNGNQVALVPDGLANSSLTWETTNQFNVGLDAGLKNPGLSLTAEAYYKKTSNLLQSMPIGLSNGFATIPVNMGSILNKGLEFTLSYDVIKNKNTSLSLGGNIGINRNQVLSLGLAPSTVWLDGRQQQKSFYLGSNISTGSFKQPVNIFMEGSPIGSFWGFRTGGIYQTDNDAANGPTFNGTPNKAGDMIFIDLNGDGNVDDLDKTIIGNPNPDFTYGFNFSFSYKQLTVSALFAGAYGNQIANTNASLYGYPGGTGANSLKESYLDAWRADAPSNIYPRIDWTFNSSVFFDKMVESGNYMRLNNLTIGYNFNIRKSVIQKANFYVSGRNLFTLTKYTGFDPVVTSYMFDSSIMGADWLGSPNLRTFMVGLNLTF